MKKSDEQLRAEANALDAAYAGAEIFDLRNENQYLRRVLHQLIMQIQEDVQVDSVTEHFWEAVDDAEEALWGEEDDA
jgi:hypothetical protein